MDHDARNDLAWNAPRRGSGNFGPRLFLGPLDRPDPTDCGPDPEEDDSDFDSDVYGADDERFDAQFDEKESDGRLCVAIILCAAVMSFLGVGFGVLLGLAT